MQYLCRECGAPMSADQFDDRFGVCGLCPPKKKPTECNAGRAHQFAPAGEAHAFDGAGYVLKKFERCQHCGLTREAQRRTSVFVNGVEITDPDEIVKALQARDASPFYPFK